MPRKGYWGTRQRKSTTLWQTSTGDINRLPATDECNHGEPTELSVRRYKEFLPWCQESHYIREGPERSYGQLSIGFPPLLERYTAMVLRNRPTALRVSTTATPELPFFLLPHSLQTLATDGTLFTSLENHWQFRPGPLSDTGPTCLVNFWVSLRSFMQLCV